MVSEESWETDGRTFTRYQMMEYICTRISEGESLPDVCKPTCMPSMQEVYKWFDNHPDFEKAYSRAEEIRAHRMGEEAREAAENTDRENVQADKLKVETLLKFAARGNRRFQDKQVVETKDEFDRMSPDQIRLRIQKMLESDPALIHALPLEHRDALGMSGPFPSSPVQDVDPVQTDTPDGVSD